ncbi:hypothetical protein AB0I86_26755 [Streptomyces sp. NPDC049950]|uniref:hypothetical protein n=1 Tax=Streptomyces sp. NPDC049950 TaxID=3156659 RepID=UPI0034447BDD
MAVSGAVRVGVWTVAVVAGVVSAGLIVALMVNPDMADRTASVTGAVVGLAGFVLALITLVHIPGTGGGGRRVKAGRGGIAAGGNITGNAIGDRSKAVGPPTQAGTAAASGQDTDVRAARDGLAAGGDVTDNALGDDSERR